MKNRWRYFVCLGASFLALSFMPHLSGSIDECCASEDHGTWCFQKEMILWKTYEDGLDYTTKKSNILTTDNFMKRSSVVPSFHWEYGFRLQAGYTPHLSPWEFTLSWAYLASKATGSKHHHADAPEFEGIFPIWSFSRNTLKGDYASDADFNWHLHTSIIDFKTSYKLCPWENITFTPFLGVEGAILNQKVHVQYWGGTFLSRIDDNLSRNRFWGVGPRFGSGVAYHLFGKFSFKGLAALTPMFGHFNTSSHEHYHEQTRFDIRESKTLVS